MMKELNVCIGSSCHIKGSYNVIQIFQQLIEELGLHDKVTMKAGFCMKQCQSGVSVSLDGKVFSVLPQNAREVFTNQIMPLIRT